MFADGEVPKNFIKPGSKNVRAVPPAAEVNPALTPDLNALTTERNRIDMVLMLARIDYAIKTSTEAIRSDVQPLHAAPIRSFHARHGRWSVLVLTLQDLVARRQHFSFDEFMEKAEAFVTTLEILFDVEEDAYAQ